MTATTIIFICRYPAAFAMPNFYAEDATILFNNVFTQNPLKAVLTPFNGYLVIGQYVLAYIAATLNLVAGGGLDTLAFLTALVSVSFLGVTASLPFVLFKKQLGVGLSLLVVLLTVLVPLRTYDYAVLGPLGNLKFAFLYIACLLLLYRYLSKELSLRAYILIDGLFFLCVLTNVTAAFLSPLLLVPYMGKLLQIVRHRKSAFSHPDLPMLLALLMVMLSGIYVAGALVRGIPEMPGYLDGPFRAQAILPILDRSTWFGLLYPFTAAYNSYFVAVGLAMTAIGLGMAALRNKEHCFVIVASIWSIALGTGLFVLNRPGISDYYLAYTHKGGPDQFFYAQTMIFIFMLGWLSRDWVRRLSSRKTAAGIIGIGLYLLLALPHGASYGGSATVYKEMKSIRPNLAKACSEYAYQKQIILQIYPSPTWQWWVDRSKACK